MRKGKFLVCAVCIITSTALHGSFVFREETTIAPRPAILPNDVMVKAPKYSVSVDFTALFLQPTSPNMHYAAEAQPFPVPTPNWVIHDVYTDYQFGFDVGIEGVINYTDSILLLNYQRFYSSDSSSVSVPSEDMLGPFFVIGPDASPYTTASGRVVFQFNEAHIDYAMPVKFGKRVRSKIFAGVSYAHIKQIFTSTYSNESESISREINVPSTFGGAGPQLGVNFTSRLVKGLHLTGNTWASLLVGCISNNTTYQSTSPALAGLGITPPNTQTTKTSSRTQMIPAFNADLGLNYIQDVLDMASVSLEAGYRAEVYVNAIQSVDMGSEVPTGSIEVSTVGVYARTFQRNLANFAMAGPYAKIELRF